MAKPKTRKSVSFQNDSSKIVEISDNTPLEDVNFTKKSSISSNKNTSNNNYNKDDEIDSDIINKFGTGIKTTADPNYDPQVEEEKEEANKPFPVTKYSIAAIPFHVPLMLLALFNNFSITEKTSQALADSLKGLVVMQSMYGIILSELISKPSFKSMKKSKKLKTPPSLQQQNEDSSDSQPSYSSFLPTSGDFLYVSVAIVLSFAFAVPLYFIIQLFGAPIGSFRAESFLLCCHISLLSFYPLLMVYKIVDPGRSSNLMSIGKMWFKMLTFQVGRDVYKHQVYLMAISTFLGAWIGVTPMPLDWDRDWQDWPITLLVGAYGGAFIGGLAGYLCNVFI
ncbi:unnamed protein product [[Candida] boidinii]|uniref:Glycosylphosphatidylinositol anchor biosynthesis protein 11 n=1 Tax=Candida boidinii TaxID=5477 RepID=A0A9W6WHB4_CANBO|nr:hypothetical protein B5S30_g459 [[Candida] boidinii]OWB82532.1 hypothetical protein B5S33_g1158 [[Candida] boidinii]GME69494.1 unnamed protein product [[Candida] boidinii]GMF98963.1 unnamed protein product [[Candida] boidinii]